MKPILLCAAALLSAFSFQLSAFAQPSPGTPPTRIAPGTGISVTTNGVNNFTITATGGSSVTNYGQSFTNTSLYSSGGTNWSASFYSTNNTTKSGFDKDLKLILGNSGTFPSTPGITFAADTTSGWGLSAAGYPATFAGTAADVLIAGTLVSRNDGSKINYPSTLYLGWSSGGVGSVDTALRRNAANSLELDSGTSGIANRGTLLAAKYTGRAGTSTASFNAAGPIYSSITAVGNVGAGEDDLISQSVAANVLASNSDRIRITAPVTFAANVNAKELKAYWNGTAFWSSSSQLFNGTSVVLTFIITRTGATTQNISTSAVSSDTLFQPVASDFDTGSATLSGAVTFKLTGEATDTNDIIQKELLIEYLPAP